MRAINDTNVPKLNENDSLIFKGIIDDIFPQKCAQKVAFGSLQTLVEEVLDDKSMSKHEQYVERIMHLYESVTMRNGVMVVGNTMTCKTQSIAILQEALNRARDTEIEENLKEYKDMKARRLGLKANAEAEDDDVSQASGNSEVDLTPEEIKMVKAKCSNKGVIAHGINPKSITLG